MQLSNKLYDALKWSAQIALPALATFYFALASVWNLPYSEEVVGTIVALDTLIGALLGISTMQYNKTSNIGTLAIDKTNVDANGAVLTQMQFDKSIEDIVNMGNKTVNVKIDTDANLTHA